MIILDNECASAVYVGKATVAFVQSLGSGLQKLIDGASKLLNIDSILKGVTSTTVTAIKGLKAALSGNFGAILDFIQQNPLKALATTAAVVGTGLVAVGIGCVIVEGAIVIGGLVASLGVTGFVATLSGIGILGGIFAGLNYLLDNPIGACISWIANGLLYLYNFDFNISDSEMQKQIEGAYVQIAGAAGGLAGFLIADLACGALPGAALVKLNLTTVHRLWEIIGEQDKQMLLSAVNGLVGSVGNLINTITFQWVFKNTRKVIQTFAENPYGAKILNTISPGFAQFVSKLGKEKPRLDAKGQPMKDADGKPLYEKVYNKPFILSQIVQDSINEIKNPLLKAFTQNAYSNAFQSCTQQLLCLSFVV